MPKVHLKARKNIVFEQPAKTRRFNTSAGMANFAFDSTHGSPRDAEKRRDALHKAGQDVRRVWVAARNLELSGARPQVQHLYVRKSKRRGVKAKQKYKYKQVSVSVPGSKFLHPEKQYVAPTDRKQSQVMEHLTAKDKKLLTDAYQKGIDIKDLRDYVQTTAGAKVSAATIYAYATRHGIKRQKRHRRSDAGERAIRLIGMDSIKVREAWQAGESWQQIQKRIKTATGTQASKSAIYAYFKERGIDRRK
jgi:hypothetical protein